MIPLIRKRHTTRATNLELYGFGVHNSPATTARRMNHAYYTPGWLTTQANPAELASRSITLISLLDDPTPILPGESIPLITNTLLDMFNRYSVNWHHTTQGAVVNQDEELTHWQVTKNHDKHKEDYDAAKEQLLINWAAVNLNKNHPAVADSVEINWMGTLLEREPGETINDLYYRQLFTRTSYSAKTNQEILDHISKQGWRESL